MEPLWSLGAPPMASGQGEEAGRAPAAGFANGQGVAAAHGAPVQHSTEPSHTQEPCTQLDGLRGSQSAAKAFEWAGNGSSTAGAPAWRQRSATPDDDAGPEGALPQPQWGPITPAAAATQAPTTPTTDAAGASAAAAGCAGAAQSAACGAAQRTATAAALWRSVRSFMQCVSGSPLVLSALLSLELASSHPGACERGATPLHWTVAQLLALFLKSGRVEASESCILASLWLMESVDSVHRSPATVCLNDYLRHLAAFSPEAVLEITKDWRASFCRLRAGVVDAQMQLLQALDWRLRLDVDSEVQPCHDLLFSVPALGRGHPGGACPAATLSARQRWAAHVLSVCASVQQQAALITKHHARLADRPPVTFCEEAQRSPTKRQRTKA